MIRLIGDEGLTFVGVAVVGVTCLSALLVASSILAIAAGLVWTNRRGRRRGLTSLPRLGADGPTPLFSRGCKVSADHGQRRWGFDAPLPHSGTPAVSPPLAGTPQGSRARDWPPVAMLFEHSTRAMWMLRREAPRGVSSDTAGPTGGARKGVE